MAPCIVIRLVNFNLHTHFDSTKVFFIAVSCFIIRAGFIRQKERTEGGKKSPR